MNTAIFLNGSPATHLPLTDRGLLYGDGLFETIAIRAGCPRLWARHMERLAEGCQRLKIFFPDESLLRAESQKLIANVSQAVLKIIIVRAGAGRGYRPPKEGRSNRILYRYPWPVWPRENTSTGIQLRICHTPLGCNPVLAGIKHLNRLEQVIARSEWGDEGIAEGLMLNTEGKVIEGTMSNLFAVFGSRIVTPSLDRCGVAGVMRELILELAQGEGLESRVGELSVSALREADEIFITNSLIGIWPVWKLEQTEYIARPVTERLRRSLERYLEQECDD